MDINNIVPEDVLLDYIEDNGYDGYDVIGDEVIFWKWEELDNYYDWRNIQKGICAKYTESELVDALHKWYHAYCNYMMADENESHHVSTEDTRDLDCGYEELPF